MSAGSARRLATAIGGAIGRLLPRHQSDWAYAMIHEIARVDDDKEALKFAAGCLWAAVLQAAAHLLSRSGPAGRRDSRRTGETERMNDKGTLARDPRAIGLACATGAVALGMAYLAAAQAPWTYIAMNGAALVIGLVACAAIARSRWSLAGPGGFVLPLLGALLLATALFGASADGATRWVRLGPLGVQVSLVVLPFMILAFARNREPAATAGLVLAALALALQPDRAMAGILAASLAALAVLRFDRRVAVALVAALAGFAATLIRPETLPASPYVDQVLYTAFEVHVLAGAAVVTGALLLVVPAIFGLAARAGPVETHAAFGMVWLGIIAAAALGNYPTPVVGYGGSAVLGYLLSLGLLPGRTVPAGRREAAPAGAEEPHGPPAMRRSLGFT